MFYQLDFYTFPNFVCMNIRYRLTSLPYTFNNLSYLIGAYGVRMSVGETNQKITKGEEL